MSYTGLGLSYSISTPWGSQTISIPIEDMARDAANAAWGAAWPPLREKLSGEIPGLVNQGMDVAYDRLQGVLPGLMDQMVQEVQPDLRAEIDRAIEIGSKRLVIGVTVLTAALAISTFIIVRRR